MLVPVGPRALPRSSCGTEREEEADSRAGTAASPLPLVLLGPSSISFRLDSKSCLALETVSRPPHAEGSPPTTPISPGYTEGFADTPFWTDAWRPVALGEPSFLSSEQTRNHSRVLPREASRSSGLSAGARRPGTANCPLSAPCETAGDPQHTGVLLLKQGDVHGLHTAAESSEGQGGGQKITFSDIIQSTNLKCHYKAREHEENNFMVL